MNFVFELTDKLPNDFRLRSLGNYKVITKYQNWIKTKASVQTPLQNLIFGNSSQKLHKNRYPSFLILFNFA